MPSVTSHVRAAMMAAKALSRAEMAHVAFLRRNFSIPLAPIFEKTGAAAPEDRLPRRCSSRARLAKGGGKKGLMPSFLSLVRGVNCSC